MFRVGSLGRDDEEEEEVAPGAITCSDTMKRNIMLTIFFLMCIKTRELQTYIQVSKSAKSFSVKTRQAVLCMSRYHLCIRNINIIK